MPFFCLVGTLSQMHNRKFQSINDKYRQLKGYSEMGAEGIKKPTLHFCVEMVKRVHAATANLNEMPRFDKYAQVFRVRALEMGSDQLYRKSSQFRRSSIFHATNSPTMFIKNISLALLALGASSAIAADTPSLRVSIRFEVKEITNVLAFVFLNQHTHKIPLWIALLARLAI